VVPLDAVDPALVPPDAVDPALVPPDAVDPALVPPDAVDPALVPPASARSGGAEKHPTRPKHPAKAKAVTPTRMSNS